MTSAQLELISTDRAWKLDQRTVEIGRAGLAQARAALAAATAVKEEFIAPDHEDQSTPAYIAPRYIAQTLVDDAQLSHRAAA